MTAVAGSAFTAAQFNTYVRDNLLETFPGKASAANQLLIGTGLNTVAVRAPATDEISTTETSSSSSFGNLATVGPTVTVTTGTSALVAWGCYSGNSADSKTLMSVEVFGATVIAAADNNSIIHYAPSTGAASTQYMLRIYSSLTAGSNIFRAKYRVTAGTGTWARRNIAVIPF